jgi:sulfite reductase alpha subunit-like flavoprotein
MRLKDYDTTGQMNASVVSSTRITPDDSETELRHIDLAVDSIDFAYQVGQRIPASLFYCRRQYDR